MNVSHAVNESPHILVQTEQMVHRYVWTCCETFITYVAFGDVCNVCVKNMQRRITSAPLRETSGMHHYVYQSSVLEARMESAYYQFLQG